MVYSGTDWLGLLTVMCMLLNFSSRFCWDFGSTFLITVGVGFPLVAIFGVSWKIPLDSWYVIILVSYEEWFRC